MHHLRLRVANKIARKLYRKYNGLLPENIPVESRSKYPSSGIGPYRKVRKFCSKACCGNPRRWYGEKTIQEIKADINEQEQINAIRTT